MRKLQTEQMHDVIAGEWVWKPNLPDIPISGGNNCQDIYNYYSGNANYAASHLNSTGGSWVVTTCLTYINGPGGNG